MQAEPGVLAVANLESTGSIMEANVEAYQAARVVALMWAVEAKEAGNVCFILFFHLPEDG